MAERQPVQSNLVLEREIARVGARGYVRNVRVVIGGFREFYIPAR